MNPESPQENFNFGIATNLVLIGFDGEKLKILTIPKKTDPFKNALVLPSKFVKTDQNIEDVIAKIMNEFTNVDFSFVEQLKAFSKVFRNPLGRVINICYYALVKIDEEILENTAKIGGNWVEINKIPDLAYDHNDIIEYAKERLKRRVKRRPIGFYLLPEKFTILQLQNLYENALDKKLDKRNFRKKIFKSKLFIETNEEDTSSKKPAKLYLFDKTEYEKLTLKGYDFLF